MGGVAGQFYERDGVIGPRLRQRSHEVGDHARCLPETKPQLCAVKKRFMKIASIHNPS